MCSLCVIRLYRLTVRGADLLDDLEVTALRQDKTSGASPRVHHTRGVPLPYRTEAAAARDALRTLLMKSWAFPAAVWGGREEGPALLADLKVAVEKATVIVDLPQEMASLGVCGYHGCTAELIYPIQDSWMECPKCGQYWSVEARHTALLGAAWASLAPAGVVVRALSSLGLKVNRKSIENWTARGRIHRYYNEQGRPEYSVAEVYYASRPREGKVLVQ